MTTMLLVAANADLPFDEASNPMDACPENRTVVLLHSGMLYNFYYCDNVANTNTKACPPTTDCFPHIETNTSVCCEADGQCMSQQSPVHVLSHQC